MSELRPHVVAASAYIAHARPFRDGYVALTSAGIETFDANLAPTGIVPGGAVGEFDVLDDGRFLSSSSAFHVCANGAWEKVESGGFLRQLLIARDRRGFFALGPDRIVIDREGTRSIVEIDKDRLTNGGALWGDGLVLSGHGGLTILDENGVELARSEEVFLTGAPVVSTGVPVASPSVPVASTSVPVASTSVPVASTSVPVVASTSVPVVASTSAPASRYVFATGTSELCVFDASARRIATLDIPAREPRAFAGGVLVRVDREDEPSRLTLWGIGTSAATDAASKIGRSAATDDSSSIVSLAATDAASKIGSSAATDAASKIGSSAATDDASSIRSSAATDDASSIGSSAATDDTSSIRRSAASDDASSIRSSAATNDASSSDESVPVERWTVEVPYPISVLTVGDRLVVSAMDAGVHIYDASGTMLAKLDIGIARSAAEFGEGLAIETDTALVWWREGRDLETLEHDVRGAHPSAAPRGLLSTESHALYLWRTDVQGPPATTVQSDLPLGIPLVIGGGVVTLDSLGRFGVRARAGDHRFVVRPGAAWRHATTRDEAVQIVQRLIGRVFDGPLPDLTREGTFDAFSARLAQLPLAQTVDLYGKSWFQQSTLDPDALTFVIYSRRHFLAELAAALGTRDRVLAGAIRARKLRLEPPRTFEGYDYVGSFTTTGTLTISDPCYIGQKANHPALGFALAMKAEANDGLWHAFIRNMVKDRDRNAELVVVHENAFGVYASEFIGSIGVDGGAAGVFDKAYKHDRDLPFDEGILGGLGAVAWSGYGDGMYPVLVGKHAGRVAKIRIVFDDDAPEVDRLIAKVAASAAKPYSAKEKFAVGDSIQHVKFGIGAVIRVADGKIDVRFDDDTRTLVHAKK